MANSPKPIKAELQREALAWAEFLYDEYMLAKHKQLLLSKQHTKIEADKSSGKEGQT
jgi:hypothetical protein